MQHIAYLSRPAFEIGAALVIEGNQLVTGDTLKLTDSAQIEQVLAVAAFGLARLVISTPAGLIECRPWKKDDDPLPTDPGAASRWTLGKVLSG